MSSNSSGEITTGSGKYTLRWKESVQANTSTELWLKMVEEFQTDGEGEIAG